MQKITAVNPRPHLSHRDTTRIEPELKIIVLQPVVPSYRIAFFERLHATLGSRFSVYSSQQTLNGLTEYLDEYAWKKPLGPYCQIAPGIQWQAGAIGIDIKSGDILIVSGAPRCLSNLAVLIKARIKGAKTVWWGHYMSSTSKPWRASLRLLLMRLSSYIIFYTDAEKHEYIRNFGTTPYSHVFALNNGIETAEISRLRGTYDASHREDRIFFIGRLTHKARLDLLFEALADPKCAAIYCDIIGSGEMEPTLRNLAKNLGLEARIRWHGAITDERLISAVTKYCKLFVYPGAVGLSLIHGLSYGLPAIVHNRTRKHNPEIAALTPEINGFVFEEGNSKSLATVISKAISDNQRLNIMSMSAIHTTENAFNAEAMAKRFVNAITEIVQGKHVGSTDQVLPDTDLR